MTNLSPPQRNILSELQKNPGSSFIFHGEWSMETAGRAFIPFKAKPAWGTFKVLMRYGLISQEIVHPKFVRYSLTEGGKRF